MVEPVNNQEDTSPIVAAGLEPKPDLQTKLIEYVTSRMNPDIVTKKRRQLKEATFYIPEQDFKELKAKLMQSYLSAAKSNADNIRFMNSNKVDLDNLIKSLSTTDLDNLASQVFNSAFSNTWLILDSYNNYKTQVEESALLVEVFKTLTKDTKVIELPATSLKLVEQVVLPRLKQAYASVLTTGDYKLIMKYKDSLQKHDLVVRYNKQLVSCKITTY